MALYSIDVMVDGVDEETGDQISKACFVEAASIPKAVDILIAQNPEVHHDHIIGVEMVAEEVLRAGPKRGN